MLLPLGKSEFFLHIAWCKHAVRRPPIRNPACTRRAPSRRAFPGLAGDHRSTRRRQAHTARIAPAPRRGVRRLRTLPRCALRRTAPARRGRTWRHRRRVPGSRARALWRGSKRVFDRASATPGRRRPGTECCGRRERALDPATRDPRAPSACAAHRHPTRPSWRLSPLLERARHRRHGRRAPKCARPRLRAGSRCPALLRARAGGSKAADGTPPAGSRRADGGAATPFHPSGVPGRDAGRPPRRARLSVRRSRTIHRENPPRIWA